MRDRCHCGGVIAFAHQDLGCLQCGEACCPCCAFSPEGHVFCPSCAGWVLARLKDAPAVTSGAFPQVRPAGVPRPIPAPPASQPSPALS